MGMPPRQSFEIVIERLGLCETWQELAAESNRLFLEIVDQHIQPMPGLLDLLDRLEEAKIPKAVATSSDKRLMDACLGHFNFTPGSSFF